MSEANLPVPFDPKVHRPASLGYRKAALLDRGSKLVAALAGGLARALGRGLLR